MKWVGRVWPWLVAFVVLVLIGGVAFRYISVFSAHAVADHEKWGQFGDYFGGVLNPILSFCAFMALLFTLKEQKQSGADNEKRHEEQQREQRFFQMMNLLTQVAGQVKMVEISAKRTQHQGRDATHGLWLRFNRDVLADVRKAEFESPMERYEELLRRFIGWRRSAWPSIGNFVETFFTVYSYIYWLIPRDHDFANFALGFLKSNLSESERLLLWYAAICTRGYHQYCTMLRLSGFVDDIDGSLDDPLKHYAFDLNFTAVAYWEGFTRDEE
ncbi:hypothetical protein GIW46_17565 [Pseudomonas syringae]|uniref:hypothetical protein n=1 Tax=Pseudomonas syringae TaxID=317 RepID=UPI002FDA5957|nr:hypothetical protein [Pseudomonas syringae]